MFINIKEKMKQQFEWQSTYLVPLLQMDNSVLRIREYYYKFRHFGEIIDFIPYDNILDIGGGMTSPLRFLNRKGIILDPLIDKYQKKFPYDLRNLNLVRCFSEYLPFDNNQLSFIITTNSLDHFLDPKKSLKEMHRVLKDKGYLFISCEIFYEDIGVRNIVHQFSFTKKSLKDLISNFFKIIKEWESPFIGIKNWLLEENTEKLEKRTQSNELILLCQKI